MVGQNKSLFFLWFIPLLAFGCFLGFHLGDSINYIAISIPQLNFYYALAVSLLSICRSFNKKKDYLENSINSDLYHCCIMVFN
jgi:hypothetical protein